MDRKEVAVVVIVVGLAETKLLGVVEWGGAVGKLG